MSEHRRELMLAGALVLLGVLVALYWRTILELAAITVGVRFLLVYIGVIGRRPKSSWSSVGRTVAIMYAAWNSRWLKPSTHGAKASSRNTFDPGDWPYTRP